MLDEWPRYFLNAGSSFLNQEATTLQWFPVTLPIGANDFIMDPNAEPLPQCPHQVSWRLQCREFSSIVISPVNSSQRLFAST
jgi:hypothetical protein